MENYKTIKFLGKGSFGEVFLVRHLKEARQYVVKKMEIRDVKKKQQDAALLEAQLLAKLHHPNIVSYKESFQDGRGVLHIVMGYCAGGDLYTHLHEQAESLLDEQLIMDWFVQIALALEYLHRHNILHRDLKTQNIFLSKSMLIKVGDFGIARVLEDADDMAMTMVGTPYYMSPELFTNQPYNFKSDIWSCGCIVYEMVTLRRAFGASSLQALILKVVQGKTPPIPGSCSKPLGSTIRAMLSQQPAKRPSADELLRLPFVKAAIKSYLSRNQKQTSSKAASKAPTAVQDKPVLASNAQSGCSDSLDSSRHQGDSVAVQNGAGQPERHSVPCPELQRNGKELPVPSSSDSLPASGTPSPRGSTSNSSSGSRQSSAESSRNNFPSQPSGQVSSTSSSNDQPEASPPSSPVAERKTRKGLPPVQAPQQRSQKQGQFRLLPPMPPGKRCGPSSGLARQSDGDSSQPSTPPVDGTEQDARPLPAVEKKKKSVLSTAKRKVHAAGQASSSAKKLPARRAKKKVSENERGSAVVDGGGQKGEALDASPQTSFDQLLGEEAVVSSGNSSPSIPPAVRLHTEQPVQVVVVERNSDSHGHIVSRSRRSRSLVVAGKDSSVESNGGQSGPSSHMQSDEPNNASVLAGYRAGKLARAASNSPAQSKRLSVDSASARPHGLDTQSPRKAVSHGDIRSIDGVPADCHGDEPSIGVKDHSGGSEVLRHRSQSDGGPAYEQDDSTCANNGAVNTRDHCAAAGQHQQRSLHSVVKTAAFRTHSSPSKPNKYTASPPSRVLPPHAPATAIATAAAAPAGKRSLQRVLGRKRPSLESKVVPTEPEKDGSKPVQRTQSANAGLSHVPCIANVPDGGQASNGQRLPCSSSEEEAATPRDVVESRHRHRLSSDESLPGEDVAGENRREHRRRKPAASRNKCNGPPTAAPGSTSQKLGNLRTQNSQSCVSTHEHGRVLDQLPSTDAAFMVSGDVVPINSSDAQVPSSSRTTSLTAEGLPDHSPNSTLERVQRRRSVPYEHCTASASNVISPQGGSAQTGSSASPKSPWSGGDQQRWAVPVSSALTRLRQQEIEEQEESGGSDLEVIQLHTLMDVTLDISDSDSTADASAGPSSDSPTICRDMLTGTDDFYSNLERSKTSPAFRRRRRLGAAEPSSALAPPSSRNTFVHLRLQSLSCACREGLGAETVRQAKEIIQETTDEDLMMTRLEELLGPDLVQTYAMRLVQWHKLEQALHTA